MVHILKNGKTILSVRNMVFDIFHSAIIDYIEIKAMDLPENIKKLLRKTDQNIYGPGGVIADVTDFLKTRKEVFIFADLVKLGIEKEKKYFIECNALELMQNFHKGILNCAQELDQ